jgi:hypothetical protein
MDGNVVMTGVVLETLDVPDYTYMKLKLGGGVEEWAAVNKTPIAVGDKVTFNQSIVMTNFHSSGLNRDFPKLIMGVLVGAPQH